MNSLWQRIRRSFDPKPDRFQAAMDSIAASARQIAADRDDFHVKAVELQLATRLAMRAPSFPEAIDILREADARHGPVRDFDDSPTPGDREMKR